MAFWNSSQILTIADGTIANDGTGDPIRTAFAKVNENFSNVAIQLSQVNQDWYNANVAFNTNLNGTTNISNLFVANATGTIGTFTGNLTANTLVAKAALYVSGVARVNGNLYMGGNIIPTTGGMYNLGTPTMPFANLYVQSTISTTQINSSSDAGLLLIHANASPGDSKDVGIFGNIASDYSNANTYAFFGHQYTTNNFVYKITNTNAVLGNNVVYDGIYGNAQLGSMFLSNSTISTSTATGTLVVGGGIGAGGNLYIGGNAYAGGFRILTTDSPGMGSFSGTTISNLAVTSIAQSISPVTGALIVNFGGLGVAGNIYSGGNVVAAALVGPYYGQIQTAAQPNVTSVGTLNSLQVGTSIGTSSITVSGSGVAAGFAPLVVAQGGANVTGGFNSFGTIASTGNVTAPFFIGNVSSPQLNTVNANVAAANIAIAAVTTAVVSYVNSLNTAMIANVNAANVSASLLNTAMIANVNAANVSASLLNTAMNANVVAANAAIVTANSAVVGYVNTLNSAMIANVNATNTAIVTANTAVVSYVNTLNGAMVTYVNSSNSSMKTYVDATAATLTSNAATLAASINSLATNSNASVAAYLQSYTGTFGTLSSLTVSGAVTVGSGITNGGSSGSGNIGSATTSFNTVFAKATSAQYADLAENYIADLDYVPGTVVVFGGDKEITVTSVIADARVAGAISTNPAYLMNDTAPGLPVALRGRIPVMVSGPVTKGDSLVTSAIPGYAMSVGCDTTYGQAVFAKTLETDLTDGLKVIEAVIL
jgi:hypothetical protein